eukprot:1407662-Amphidinium_carterae.1
MPPSGAELLPTEECFGELFSVSAPETVSAAYCYRRIRFHSKRFDSRNIKQMSVTVTVPEEKFPVN